MKIQEICDMRDLIENRYYYQKPARRSVKRLAKRIAPTPVKPVLPVIRKTPLKAVSEPVNAKDLMIASRKDVRIFPDINEKVMASWNKYNGRA
jgi:hypothetical protein